MTQQPVDEGRQAFSPLDYRLIGLCGVVVVGGVGATSAPALVVALADALDAALILVPAILAGRALVPALGLSPMPRRWQWLIGAALGIGFLSSLVFLGGVVGALNRSLAVGVLVALAVIGFARMAASGRADAACELDQAPSVGAPEESRAWSYLWLLACPFLVLAILAAVNPPGLIWSEEAWGYDVLEYHLQLPKEYLKTGHIGYVAHNVYANFPSNVEMLYLLGMLVHGEVESFGTVANMVHLAFAVLTVLSAWAIGRDVSPKVGVITGVAAATSGWLVYLSGLAYVENGLLFFGMTAAGALLRAFRAEVGRDGENADGPGVCHQRRWLGVSGALSGLALGCKYTAGPMTVLPLALCSALLPGRGIRGRVADVLVFSLVSGATMSPWLVRNLAHTGNPVFPLANNIFQAAPPGWGAEETARWDDGHSLSAGQRSLGSKVAALWKHVVGDADQRLGPTLLALPLLSLLWRQRSRVDLILGLFLIVQLCTWLFATHLYSRFLVPLVIPLSILAGRSLLHVESIAWRKGVVIVLIAGAIWSFSFGVRLSIRESVGAVPASVFTSGSLPGYEYLGVINEELAADAKILLVGDARPFYIRRDVAYCVTFNRNPFFEAVNAAGNVSQVAGWLHRRGFTHVLIHWSEARRLAGTYGFSPPMRVRRLRDVFGALEREGLARVREFAHPDGAALGPYISLYELPGSP